MPLVKAKDIKKGFKYRPSTLVPEVGWNAVADAVLQADGEVTLRVKLSDGSDEYRTWHNKDHLILLEIP